MDLNYLLTCKKEKLIPTFAKPKLSIGGGEHLRLKIAKLVIGTEIKNKHAKKRTLRREIKDLNRKIESKLGLLSYNALKYRISREVSKKKKKWTVTHDKKLNNLRSVKERNDVNAKESETKTLPTVIHNFSNYVLSDEEVRVLSKTLDHYIPTATNGKSKRIQVEFERFYNEILFNADNLNMDQKLYLKTSFLNTFNSYSKVKVKLDDKSLIDGLYKNDKIVVLRQDKGRGVVIMNKTDYVRKCECFLSGPEFEMLPNDPTKTFQTQVQNVLRKMKDKFTTTEYKQLYPSASQPGLFFGMAKVHKLKDAQADVKDLPLRPVISNIGTATYHISKHLAKLLSPLTKSEHNIVSTKDFINKLKKMKIKSGYKMVSLDVVSLFTSVPLDYTINVILDKVYKERKIETKLSRDELRSLLELCTKKMHFSFNNKIYKQTNGVTMGSPLGPVIANIFMVNLEEMMIPRLSDKMSAWYRYVDDTFTFVKEDEIESVQETLNMFHDDIKFTYESETDHTLSFLDVSITRRADGKFDTTVYRKKTDSSIYINWDAFATRQWKIGTLKGLFRRAFLVCSTNKALKREISYLKRVFTKTNGYPSKIVNKTLFEIRRTYNESVQPEQPDNSPIEQPNSENAEVTPYMCLPYKGTDGERVVRDFKRSLRNVLPSKIKPRFLYKGTKLGTFFSVKDKVDKVHQSNLVYVYT